MEADITLSPTGKVIITEVDFADEVVLANTRETPFNLAGHWLCNQPACLELAGTLEPGESVRISAAPLAGLDPGGGEVALYQGREFHRPETLLDYVTWGEEGPSMTLAVQAGLWSPSDTILGVGERIVRTDALALGAAGWTVTD